MVEFYMRPAAAGGLDLGETESVRDHRGVANMKAGETVRSMIVFDA
jgi:hypothetical protein